MKDSSEPFSLRRLRPGDQALYEDMLALFGRVFREPETYGSRLPGDDYRDRLLADERFVAIVALSRERVVGALVAYELKKFEQERSEFYIYDLAVDRRERRRGIATALIRHTCEVARQCGGWVVMVQADREDTAAVELYSRLGEREEVLHFDIPLA